MEQIRPRTNSIKDRLSMFEPKKQEEKINRREIDLKLGSNIFEKLEFIENRKKSSTFNLKPSKNSNSDNSEFLSRLEIFSRKRTVADKSDITEASYVKSPTIMEFFEKMNPHKILRKTSQNDRLEKELQALGLIGNQNACKISQVINDNISNSKNGETNINILKDNEAGLTESIDVQSTTNGVHMYENDASLKYSVDVQITNSGEEIASKIICENEIRNDVRTLSNNKSTNYYQVKIEVSIYDWNICCQEDYSNDEEEKNIKRQINSSLTERERRINMWKLFLYHYFVRTQLYTKVLIVHGFEGGCWISTENNFTFRDGEEFSRIKDLYEREGRCEGDCSCVTTGIEFLGENHRFLNYFSYDRVLSYNDMDIFCENFFCIFAKRQNNLNMNECLKRLIEVAQLISEWVDYSKKDENLDEKFKYS